MHNDRVIRTTRLALTVALAVAALATSACSGSGSSQSAGTGSPSSGSQGSAGVVDGVTLTPQGSHLSLGDSATVSWQPDQRTTGVIKVAVTRLRRVPIRTFSDWRLTGEVRRSTPYFVDATVTNVGKSDLSHEPVPLYLLDQRDTLLQTSTFQARFPACPSRPLPAKFRKGDKTSVCLVYFVPDHGKLVAISFRPSQDFDAILWTGPVSQPKKHKKKH
jgi:hypothetical protein